VVTSVQAVERHCPRVAAVEVVHVLKHFTQLYGDAVVGEGDSFVDRGTSPFLCERREQLAVLFIRLRQAAGHDRLVVVQQMARLREVDGGQRHRLRPRRRRSRDREGIVDARPQSLQ
jgi:hypothetical protein